MMRGYMKYGRGHVLYRENLHIFTDGSSWPNTGLGDGGWGAVLLHGEHRLDKWGGARCATNNQMELTAILRGLQAVRNPCITTIVYSDSKYCLGALTEWWPSWVRNGMRTAAGKPVANQELLQAIQAERERFKHLRFCWIKGHAGNEFNERADALARLGREGVDKHGEEEQSERHGWPADTPTEGDENSVG